MDALATLRTKITDLKNKIEQSSISPIYLGSILDELLTFIDTADNALSGAISNNRAKLEKAIADQRAAIDIVLEKHLKAIHDAAPRTISLSKIDTMGTDGSRQELLGIVSEAAHTRWLVCDDSGHTVGCMDIVSDHLGHVLTQILTTHFALTSEGELSDNTHTCAKPRTIFRSFNLSAPSSFPVGRGTWTPWAETEPESIRRSLTLLTPVFLESEEEYERMKAEGELDPDQWYAVAEEED